MSDPITVADRIKRAEELSEKYDTGISVLGVTEDELNGFIGIFDAADVRFEHAPDIDSIYFDYPETEGNDNGE